ncbi:MAG: epoxide hydrolase family protein [Acidimicrobiales bacterium]
MAVTAPAQPFTVHVADEVLEDLRYRLEHTRWPLDYNNDDWRYGANRAYLESFVDYWAHEFDWRKMEAQINAFANFRCEIDGIPIHFIHEKGKGPNPIPVILTHGWPWTFWDLNAVIRPLSDPASFGGDPADAFDVIVPSLPGYGFSTPLTTPGVNSITTADLWHTLMTEALGYSRYGAQGGDWGAIVSAQMGHKYADELYGVHLTLPALPGPDAKWSLLKPEAYGPGEEGWYDRYRSKWDSTTVHMSAHSRSPQTLAFAFNDSPVGLAAWIIERRRAWGDTGGDVESRFSKEFLATTLTIYWVTESIGTSMRYYWERANAHWQPSHDRKPTVEAPTGIPVFPGELILMPRSIAEKASNLVHWTIQPEGGHFAPAEVPDLVVADVRQFFRKLR